MAHGLTLLYARSRGRLALVAAGAALAVASCNPGELFSGKLPADDDGCAEGTACVSPPPDACADGVLVLHEASGSCEQGSCRYPSSEVVCEHGCLEGAAQCRDAPTLDCAGVTCPPPPSPSCEDDQLVSWEATCVEEGAGPVCGVAVAQAATCEYGCDVEAAQCRGPPPAVVQIDDPYRDVAWSTWHQAKANFHTHTTESDGGLAPAEVIDRYHAAGYGVLALTDHNKNTWPWGSWDRDAAALGMVGLSGNEFSAGHHLNGLVSTRTGSVSSDERVVLDALVADGGLGILNHPGRYSRTTQWYVDLYRDYQNLVGLEVYNQGDRYPGDRETWDAILTVTMPERPVWGHSCDDMHGTSALFGNYSFLLLPTLSEAEVREALLQGRSYFSYEPGRSGEARAPRIQAIFVDPLAGTIRLEATGQTEVRWIADGVQIAQGETLDVGAHFLAGAITGYVRAQLVGELGKSYTQPFGVRPAEPPPSPP